MRPSDVTLRPIEREDLAYLRDLANDPVVRGQVVGWDWPLSLAAQERWFAGGVDTPNIRRFIILDGSGVPVGLTGLWDIDWHNRAAMSAIKIGGIQQRRGLGYGTQAIRMMMDFAFNDVGLHRLRAEILEFNEASIRLYRDKCAWAQEGLSREAVWKGGRYWNVVHLGILRDEYLRWVADGDN